jgi:ABC-2 type transport system ATP-binding protein
MRQRIKMAQSLVHDPTVLFLDEPFTGTDPIARRDLMDIVPATERCRQERDRLQPCPP